MPFKYDFYLAGPFFNDAQKATMQEAKVALNLLGITVADPQALGPVIVDTAPERKTPEFFAAIFDGNIYGMDESWGIIACIDDKDIGTAFELGYMFANSKGQRPIFTFSAKGTKTNVMLAQCVDRHFETIEEMASFMSEQKKYIDHHSIVFKHLLSVFETKKAEASE